MPLCPLAVGLAAVLLTQAAHAGAASDRPPNDVPPGPTAPPPPDNGFVLQLPHVSDIDSTSAMAPLTKVQRLSALLNHRRADPAIGPHSLTVSAGDKWVTARRSGRFTFAADGSEREAVAEYLGAFFHDCPYDQNQATAPAERAGGDPHPRSQHPRPSGQRAGGREVTRLCELAFVVVIEIDQPGDRAAGLGGRRR